MTVQISTIKSQDVPDVSQSQSFSSAVHARYTEYTRTQKIRLKIGSWNTAARLGTENDIASWFVQSKSQSDPAQRSDDEKSNNTEEVLSTTTASQVDRIEYTEKVYADDDHGKSEVQEEVGIYVLGLQEVTGLTTAREYFGRIYTDPEPTSRWRKALVEALPSGYVQIMEQQLSGLLLFIYASPSIAPKINSVSTVTVATSMIGYLGNKGAIATRIVLAETTRIVFVNSHLASGAEPQQLERRFWEIEQILQKTVFEPINCNGYFTNYQEKIGDEDFTFWFGDLNFRLDGLPGEEIRRLLMIMSNESNKNRSNPWYMIDDEIGEDETFVIHSESDDENEDGTENKNGSKPDGLRLENPLLARFQEPDTFVIDPSQDPASLQSTLNCLLPHDQLKRAQSNNRVFHDGWKEGLLSFLPTYKYDIGTEISFDSSEKKRAPSWCDRILYRTRRDKNEYEEKLKNSDALNPGENEDIDIKENNDARNHEDLRYDYDPGTDGLVKCGYDADEECERGDSNQMMQEETIELDSYTSHQEVTSSDHKPIHATFSLSYDIIIPELKAKIQQEVVRHLDRTENERRPGVTVIIDRSANDSYTESLEVAIDAVNFGQVAFRQKIIRTLTIANTSQALATIYFLDKGGIDRNGNSDSSRWLSVYFFDLETNENGSAAKLSKSEVKLEPGDSINVALEIMVQDVDLVRALNENSLQLEEILVLRVADGPDHFIPVHGSWLQTCLGRSINELLRIPDGGVRTLPLSKDGGIPLSSEQDSRFSAPRELYRLTEAIQSLIERVMADSNILENANVPQDSPGWPFDSKHWAFKNSPERDIYVQLVIEALDTGRILTEVFTPETLALEKLEVISEVLLLFLSYLSDGIITRDLWSSLDSTYANRGNSPEEIKAWTLDTLSTEPNHSISFVFLTSMLAQVIAELAPESSNSNSCSSSFVLSSKRSSNVPVIDMVKRQSIVSWRVKSTTHCSPQATPPFSPLPLLLLVPDPMLTKRELIVKEITKIFVPIIFKDDVDGCGSLKKEREKQKILNQKQYFILQNFIAL